MKDDRKNKDFLEYICCPTAMNMSLEAVILWIQQNLYPEDVFSAESLRDWAGDFDD